MNVVCYERVCYEREVYQNGFIVLHLTAHFKNFHLGPRIFLLGCVH